MGNSKNTDPYEISKGFFPWNIECVTIKLHTRFKYKYRSYLNDEICISIEESEIIRRRIQQIIKQYDLYKSVNKSKKLIVEFSVNCILGGYPKSPTWYKMKFNFLDGEVYLNMDKSYKRSLKLKDLGI
jgi:hypothetical protein